MGEAVASRGPAVQSLRSEDGTAAGLLCGVSQGCGGLPPAHHLPRHLTSGGLEEQVAQGPHADPPPARF